VNFKFDNWPILGLHLRYLTLSRLHHGRQESAHDLQVDDGIRPITGGGALLAGSARHEIICIRVHHLAVMSALQSLQHGL
jgi:hypothetical protein